MLDQSSKMLLKQQLLSLSSLLTWAVAHQQNDMYQHALQQIKSTTAQYFAFDHNNMKLIEEQVAKLQQTNVAETSTTIDKTMNALVELEDQLRKS